jgi:hypothetical protein
MSLVVALLMMFVSDVLSQTELAPAPSPIYIVCSGSSEAEANALNALYTGWGILSAMGGKEDSDPCTSGWEGVICVNLVQLAVEPGSCYTFSVIGL